MTIWQEYLGGLDPDARREVEEWYESRPPAIQALCRRFPPRSIVRINDHAAYVLTYMETEGEGPGLMCSFTDPGQDYDLAMATRFFVCGSHL